MNVRDCFANYADMLSHHPEIGYDNFHNECVASQVGPVGVVLSNSELDELELASGFTKGGQSDFLYQWSVR